MTKRKIPIHIPSDLFDEIQRRVQSSHEEFRSVEEYVEFVLREVVKEEEPEQVYAEEEVKGIKERLKNLGYT